MTIVQGRIIAVVHRADDVGHKLVVAVDERRYTADEMFRQIQFMEQFFQSCVEVVVDR